MLVQTNSIWIIFISRSLRMVDLRSTSIVAPFDYSSCNSFGIAVPVNRFFSGDSEILWSPIAGGVVIDYSSSGYFIAFE